MRPESHVLVTKVEGKIDFRDYREVSASGGEHSGHEMQDLYCWTHSRTHIMTQHQIHGAQHKMLDTTQEVRDTNSDTIVIRQHLLGNTGVREDYIITCNLYLSAHDEYD